jgi:hypothetical protein
MRLEQAEETDRLKEEDRDSAADCIQAKKAVYEAAIPSKPVDITTEYLLCYGIATISRAWVLTSRFQKLVCMLTLTS